MAELQARIEVLEQRLRRLDEENAAAHALTEDARRLEELAERTAAARRAAEAALEGIKALAAGSGPSRPRSRPTFNVIYQAETAGYVSLFFTGGRTDRIRLLAGAENPPIERVCELDCSLTSYAGGIVRPGEYWMVESKRGGRSGVECVFTPLS